MKNREKPNEIVVQGLKSRAPFWRRFSRTVFCLLVAFRLAFLVINMFGYSIFLSGVPQSIFLFFYDGLLLLCLIFSVRWKRKTSVICGIITAMFLLFLYGTNVFSYEKDKSYIEISSPAGTNTLIVEESAYLFSGRCRFYRKENAFLLRATGAEIRMDDGYQSFRENPRQLLWLDENTAEFTGYVEGQTPGKTRLLIRLK